MGATVVLFFTAPVRNICSLFFTSLLSTTDRVVLLALSDNGSSKMAASNRVIVFFIINTVLVKLRKDTLEIMFRCKFITFFLTIQIFFTFSLIFFEKSKILGAGEDK